MTPAPGSPQGPPPGGEATHQLVVLGDVDVELLEGGQVVEVALVGGRELLHVLAQLLLAHRLRARHVAVEALHLEGGDENE